MPRIAPVDPATAEPAAKAQLEAVQKKLGTTPNMMSTMAQSPAVLEAIWASRAALQFARQVNDQRGKVTDQQVEAVRAAGFGDGAIVEIIANVALNVLTNYFNTATQVEVDFPEVRPAAESATA